ncbi:MAG: CBS domain-containing protein [Gammaproteobacteria bacterium]|nr:CBS domain-containing protein [Gammaproteobacteria bacterium]MDH3415627.1 CBS domain-containing protein [Gammaproteobacteria bacterium]
MKLVKHLLDSKGRHIVSVVPDSTVLEAIKLMADKAIGSLIVMDDDELLGIVTERDYARKVIIKGRSSQTTRVSEIMTTNVFTTTSTKSVNDCMSLMTEKRIRHLPVLEDNRVIGVISIGDLVQAIISDQKEEIEQLENYISGM